MDLFALTFAVFTGAAKREFSSEGLAMPALLLGAGTLVLFATALITSVWMICWTLVVKKVVGPRVKHVSQALQPNNERRIVHAPSLLARSPHPPCSTRAVPEHLAFERFAGSVV